MAKSRRRKRPKLSDTDYRRIAKQLGLKKYAKKTLTKHDKTAITRASERRPDSDYIQSANKLSSIVPKLKKFKRRKKLTRAEKANIRKKERQLKYMDHLIPVKKKDLKTLRPFMVGPGIQAVQLRNTGNNVKLSVLNGDMLIESNGRLWLYWSLDKLHSSDMAKAGETAFGIRGAFPMEQILELAQLAYNNPRTMAVGLWTAQGRVGNPFPSMRQFLEWITLSYSTYADVEKWVNGIAVLISDSDEKLSRDDVRDVWYGHDDDFEEDTEEYELDIVKALLEIYSQGEVMEDYKIDLNQPVTRKHVKQQIQKYIDRVIDDADRVVVTIIESGLQFVFILV